MSISFFYYHMARAPKKDATLIASHEAKTDAEKLAEKPTGYSIATAKDSDSKKQ